MTGSGTPSDPYVIWDANDLQNMNLDPAACYELGQDIDASATAGWNGGLGFDPVDVPDIRQYDYATGDDSQGGAWNIFPADGIYWDKINEVVPDEDARYIQATANGSWVLFSFGGVTPPPAHNHFRVTVEARARRVAAGSCRWEAYIRMSGTVYRSGDYEYPDVAYADMISHFQYNPETGLPWTVADLSNIEAFGVYVADASPNLRLTQIRLALSYGTFTFDGKGHTVTGLTINRPLEDYVALFGEVYYPVIQNVNLVAANITGDDYVGALAGRVYVGTYTNCLSSGIVTGDRNVGGLIGWGMGDRLSASPVSYVGGVVGYGAPLPSQTASYTGCSSSCVVTATGSNSGGFMGYLYYSRVATCHATGNITGDFYAAGFIGQARYNTFTDSYATGSVIMSDSYSGGFIGQCEDNVCTDCYATGDITSTGGQVGGFIGQDEVDIYTRCYATGNVTTTGLGVGGFGGRTTIDLCTDCYATGDVTVTGNDRAGGFTGGDHATSIYLRCYATGNVTADDVVGGFTVRAFGTYTQCYATGNVTGGVTPGDRQVGGFAAWLSQATMTDCYCLGDVSGNTEVGGFTGELNHASANITRCYCKGQVTGNANVGGFVGLLAAGTITACFWDIETSGQSTSVGGYGETTARMQDIDTFLAAGWDIETHNSVDMAEGYPFLSWQIPGSSPVWYIFVPPGAPPPFPKVATLPATEIR